MKNRILLVMSRNSYSSRGSYSHFAFKVDISKDYPFTGYGIFVKFNVL